MRVALAVVLGVVAFVSALIASAARSDFMFRGCAEIPRDAWPETANCADGWLAQIVFGLTAGANIAVALWILLRRPAR